MSNGHPEFEKSYKAASAALFERFAHWLEPKVPAQVTPTQVTWWSIVAAVAAAIALYLASFNSLWFVVAIVGVALHLILDYLDGTMARVRGMTSPQGFFLDAFSDTMVSVLTFVAIGASSYGNLSILLFPAVMHALHLAMSLYWILLRQKWIMPNFGDVELHAALIGMILLTWALGKQPIEIFDWALYPFDIASIILAPLTLVELLVSARQLYISLGTPATTES